MGTWKVNLDEQTATSTNGLTFKLTEAKPEKHEFSQIDSWSQLTLPQRKKGDPKKWFKFFLAIFISMGSLILGMIFCPVGKAYPEESLKYKGMKLSTLPLGHQYLGGYLFDIPGKDRYGVDLIRHETHQIMWLVKILGHDKQGNPIQEIKSVIPPRKIPKGQAFFFSSCQLNGKWDTKIVAIVQLEDREELKQIMSAWRVNLDQEKFESIPTKGVSCIIEGWGHK